MRLNQELIDANTQHTNASNKALSKQAIVNEDRVASANFAKDIQDEKNLWPESSKETFAADAQTMFEKIQDPTHTMYGNTEERLSKLRANLEVSRRAPAAPIETIEKPGVPKTKARLTQKQAGAGVAGALVAVGAGVVATVVGSQLQLASDDPCSSFGNTIATMENQLYNQSQTIQADLNALSAMQR